MLYCYYSHYTIMQKFLQLTRIVIGLEVLDNRLIFPDIARHQEKSNFV